MLKGLVSQGQKAFALKRMQRCKYLYRYLELKKFFIEHSSTRLLVARIESTEGSTYKKKGSFKLVNPEGSHVGMLSGGCLEQEIVRKTLETDPGACFDIDTRSEEDKFFGSGTGCQGLLRIRVERVAEGTSWDDFKDSFLQGTKLPFVKIVGAGADVVPLAEILDAMHWAWIAVDYRQAHVDNFKTHPSKRLKIPVDQLKEALQVMPAARQGGQFSSAYVLMSHSFEYDLQGLVAAIKETADYIGVLGPARRRDELVASAKKELGDRSYDWGRVKGPMGISGLGRGEEAVALSVAAEMMRVLN